MKDNGLRINNMGMVLKHGLMERSMMVIMIWVKNMGKEYLIGLMGQYIMASLAIIMFCFIFLNDILRLLYFFRYMDMEYMSGRMGENL